jgi:hypothetical protein
VEVRRSRSSSEDWEVTLTCLLTQSAAATARYQEAQRDVPGLALRVVEIEMKKTRPECDIPCKFGTLPKPDKRERELLVRVLLAENDDDAVTRLTYHVQHSRPEPTMVDEDVQYLEQARHEPYLAEGLQCAGFGDLRGLLHSILEKHYGTLRSSPFSSPARR